MFWKVSLLGGEFHFLFLPSLTHLCPWLISLFGSYCHHRCSASIITVGSTMSLEDGRGSPVSLQAPLPTLTTSSFICSNTVLSWFLVRKKIDAICECSLQVQSNWIFSHKYKFWRGEPENILLLKNSSWVFLTGKQFKDISNKPRKWWIY